MRLMVLSGVLAFVLAACASPPTQTIDSRATVKPGVSEMSPKDASPAVESAYSQLIDVREPSEYAAGHASRARNIPLSSLSGNLDRIEKNEPVYLIGRTDNRSREAAKILEEAGFGKVIVITGGY